MTDLEFSGAISAIDPDKRVLTMVDEHGVTHPFKWSTGAQDEFFQKQKIGYGLTLKYDEESRAIKSAAFWKKPEGFNKKPWTGGGKPRNEKPVIFESVLKTCSDAFSDNTTIPYEKKMERIWAVAKKISLEIIRESGA